MQGRQWVWLGVHLVAVAAVAVGGSLATTANVEGWYAAAAQPAWTPPNRLFGPVWTVLYAGMALAGWLVQRRAGADRDEPQRRRAVALYWLQLLLNAAWSPVFFAGYPLWGPAALWVAAVIIVVLVVLVAWCAAEFSRRNRFAGAVMVVYLLWLLYATTLNVGVAVLNS